MCGVPGVLTGCVSLPAGNVTERGTATLEMTRLLRSALGRLRPSVGTSLAAALGSVWTRGKTGLS